MVLKIFGCECGMEFALIGNSAEEDETLSCPSCLGYVEPVGGEDEDDDANDDGVDWGVLARLFRRDDDD